MTESLEEVIREAAEYAYAHMKKQKLGDRGYERLMSEKLTEKEIRHDTHFKVFDAARGKYRFIDIYFPDHGRFVDIKTRRAITRTDIKELRDDEVATNLPGLLVNFHNGFDIRGTTDLDDGFIQRLQNGQITPLPRIHQGRSHRSSLPQLSVATGKFDPGEKSPGINKNILSPFNLSGESLGIQSFNNANKVYALSCVAFFLSEGDRTGFVNTFNDLLESSKLERVRVPSSVLKGPKLKPPDGELAELLPNVLNKYIENHPNVVSTRKGSSSRTGTIHEIENGQAERRLSSRTSENHREVLKSPEESQSSDDDQVGVSLFD